jgi:two-component system, sensor histidine kinase LadS
MPGVPASFKKVAGEGDFFMLYRFPAVHAGTRPRYNCLHNSMKKMLILLLAFAFFGSQPAAAASSEEDRTTIHLEGMSDFYFNALPALGIGEVSDKALSANFTPVAGRQIWVGKKAPAAWLRFTVPTKELGAGYNGSADGNQAVSQWILVVRPSFSIILDHVDLYVPRNDGSYEKVSSGAKVVPRAGEPYSRFFVFGLSPGAFMGKPCYLRLSSGTDVEVKIDLETGVGFAQHEGFDYFAYGLVYGILVAMILYSLFLFVSLKDSTYLCYILYIVSAGLWLFFVQGHAKLIFGQKPGFDQAMLWLWAGSMITWGAVFTAVFLRLKESRTILYYVFLALAALGAIVSIAGLAGLNGIAFSLSHILGLVLPVLVIAAAIARLVQGFPSAFYFLIAWSLLAVGGFIFSLMGLKILPVNFWTVNGMALGMTAEAILLSMALADRFKRLEAEKKNLEKIQVHYRELSLTDALTGLHNKRFLKIELDLAVSRAGETGTPLSLILLDLDDFKNINDSFGHSVGDDILATLARSMRSCTRESDSSCRFGGDEFVIIMPGVKGEGAFGVAERIRNRFASDSLHDVDGVEVKATVSLGTVEFNGGETAEAFLSRADGAMYEAKRLGKNRSVAR